MQIRFIAQPFQHGYDLRDFLAAVLLNAAVSRLDIAVAWAKRSGLRIVRDAIGEFRARGGYVRIVVGVDEGGATRQGLEMLMHLADESYVFHSHSGGTFHPKVYAAYGDRFGAVLTGSQNFTAGGLVENFEAATIIEFDPRTSEGGRFLHSVIHDFIGGLIEDRAVCKRLDPDLMASLLVDPQIRIGDEDAPRQSERLGAASMDLPPSAFGRSQHPLRSAPRSSASVRPSATDDAPGGGRAPQSHAEVVHPAATTAVVRRWFKRMSQADAQRPNEGTNPTGHLTLTQKPHPIDHRKYFRYTFFADLHWSAVGGGNGRVEAELEVDVSIDGAEHGRFTLLVDHNPDYEADQGNRTTFVHWGESMNELFRRENHVGKTVTIERFEDGKTRITIAMSETGPFLP